MKRLKTSDIVSGVGYPPSKKGTDFLWLSNKEMLNVLAQTFGGELVANAAYVLYGCKKTSLGGGNFSFSAGAIYDSASGEIYLMDAIATIPIATAPVMTITTTYSPTYNSVLFTDGTSKNVHEERKLVVSDGALGSANINYADLIFAQPVLKTKVVEIGNWNMDSTDSVNIAHGIANFKKIRSITVMIRDDTDTLYIPITGSGGAGGLADVIDGYAVINGSSTNIEVRRITGGVFDDGDWTNVTSYNRGWITISYEP